MKAQMLRQQPTPRRASLRLLLLAFALFIAQPAHWMVCCLVSFSGAHATPSASHGHAEQMERTFAPDGGGPWNVAHQGAEVEVSDAKFAGHTVANSAARADRLIVTSHSVRDSHHHHLPCGPDCDVAALTQRTVRHDGGSGSITAFLVPATPVFLLDARQSQPTRAGPTHTRAISVHLTANLLGRAPPLSV